MKYLLAAVSAVAVSIGMVVMGLDLGGQTALAQGLARPAPRPSQQSNQPSQSAGPNRGHAGHHPHTHWNYPYYSRSYRRPNWYFHGYDPYWRPQYPYGYPPSYPYPYSPYSWGYRYYYPPPLYIPAEELYGPRAVQRFMGVDRLNVPAAAPRIIIQKANGEKKGVGRATNPEALALAWKFIGFGDAHFANQKYVDAFQRYKKAAQAAPGLAHAYFRQGCALAAQERYELAAKALKRGLALDPGWARSKFQLDELYGPNQLAKKAHLDALTKAVAARPRDADLVFLLAVWCYFDGHRDRAAQLMPQAAGMLGPDAGLLDGFLAELKER